MSDHANEIISSIVNGTIKRSRPNVRHDLVPTSRLLPHFTVSFFLLSGIWLSRRRVITTKWGLSVEAGIS